MIPMKSITELKKSNHKLNMPLLDSGVSGLKKIGQINIDRDSGIALLQKLENVCKTIALKQ